jgi:hypothetical protein
MEMFDEDLIGMVNFTDETAPKQMPVMEQKESQEKKQIAVNDEKYTEQSKRTAYIRKRTDLQRIGSGLKWLLPCGIIAWMLWQFLMNDLMVMKAAYPCIFACGCIGFGGFFWNARA